LKATFTEYLKNQGIIAI